MGAENRAPGSPSAPRYISTSAAWCPRSRRAAHTLHPLDRETLRSSLSPPAKTTIFIKRSSTAKRFYTYFMLECKLYHNLRTETRGQTKAPAERGPCLQQVGECGQLRLHRVGASCVSLASGSAGNPFTTLLLLSPQSLKGGFAGARFPHNILVSVGSSASTNNPSWVSSRALTAAYSALCFSFPSRKASASSMEMRTASMSVWRRVVWR